VSDFEAKVRELAARASIHEVIVQYFTGIDRRDWDLVADCFTADATANYDEHEIGPGPAAIVDHFQGGQHSGIGAERHTVATSHLAANLAITLDGDTETTETLITAYLLRARDDAEPDQVLVRGIRYLDGLREDADGRWRVYRRVHTADWMYAAPLSFARLRDERVVSLDQL
jgi:ketosteroid isomerase-like protein